MMKAIRDLLISSISSRAHERTRPTAAHGFVGQTIQSSVRSPSRIGEDIYPTLKVSDAIATVTCQRCVKPNLANNRVDLSIESMRKSARSGCMKCCTILCGLIQVQHLYEAQEHQDPAEHQVSVFFADPTVTVTVLGQYKGPGRRRLFSKSIELCFNIEKGVANPLPELLIPHGISLHSRSEACFGTIKQWLINCETNHTSCTTETSSNSSVWLPTRLLHVHDVRVVLNVEIHDPTVKYAALSHCWGTATQNTKPLPRTLNKMPTRNLDSRRHGIAWDELTTSFQDAIIIARELEFDYIWIDSLCIIQDDDADWTVEAAAMARTYGNAHLVISATRSASGDGGIFSSRSSPVRATIPNLDDLAITIRSRPKHANFFTSHKPDFSQDPVFDRGWCFQERLLAKRIIHFTEQELVWECSEDLDCECGTIKREAFVRKEGNHDKRFKTRFGTLLHSEDEWEQNSCWLNILEEYTARKLTKESDRLPALSGIAQKLESSRHGRYFAGHWENSLPNSLLWNLPFGEARTRMALRRIPDIPTWAWPSVATAITPHFQTSQKHLTLTTTTKLIDVYCDLVSTNPFGQVKGGYIVLEGPVKEVLLQPNEIEGLKSLVDPSNSNLKCRLLPDSHTDLPPDGEKVYCLGIEFDTTQGRTNGFLCLLLRRSERNYSEYRRIAQANCLSVWLESAQTQKIRIV